MRLWLSAALLGFAGLSSCRPATGNAAQASAQSAGTYNVILISIDTLRADHLGSYGYQRDTSPSIDALARRGARFANVCSEASWTAPSQMTLFTGLYPTTHGLRYPGAWVPHSIETLPEILHNNGYRTFAFVGGGYVSKAAGFARGFEHFHVKDRRGLDEAFDHARDYIAGINPGEHFFAFIHGYDLHSPYEDESPYASMFQSSDAEPFGDWHRNELLFKDDGTRLTPGNIQFLADHYDGGIRRVDDLLGRFIRFLDQRKLLNSSVLVLLSDHGEEFGEHGFVGHRGALYREYISPPLIIVAPGVKPSVIEHGVGLKDVMPTILELAGLSAPVRQGRSLTPLLHGATVEPWPLFSEVDNDGNYRSLIWDQWHLIVRPYRDAPMLFDWRHDPTEQHNVAVQNPERIRELLALMPDPPKSLRHPEFDLSQLENPKDRPNSPAALHSEITDASEETSKLRSLGYVGP